MGLPLCSSIGRERKCYENKREFVSHLSEIWYDRKDFIMNKGEEIWIIEHI